jgi:hypothetical protein
MAVQLQNIIHDVLEDVHCRAEMHLTELTTLNFPDKDVYQQLTTNIDDGDTYGADALLLKTALHVPVNSRGSRQRYIKWEK